MIPREPTACFHIEFNCFIYLNLDFMKIENITFFSNVTYFFLFYAIVQKI